MEHVTTPYVSVYCERFGFSPGRVQNQLCSRCFWMTPLSPMRTGYGPTCKTRLAGSLPHHTQYKVVLMSGYDCLSTLEKTANVLIWSYKSIYHVSQKVNLWTYFQLKLHTKQRPYFKNNLQIQQNTQILTQVFCNSCKDMYLQIDKQTILDQIKYTFNVHT